ncbi:hypothetical protein EYF80_004150 [Liparis tanakae]|uniref:Uncharacterized protein n=1 Tax=Liparis tanakae TaxID=230148 RepID=A0A4Z2J674_9TELE|nr:hypothetical protein EYF80_004150 [Liparis tanakae]
MASSTLLATSGTQNMEETQWKEEREIKVSQSHPFMCNACKPMHSDTMAQQRDMRGENELLSKWVRADKHHRTTTVFKISISNNDKSSRSHRVADTEEGRRTTRTAVSHWKRLQINSSGTHSVLHFHQ